MDFSYFAIKMLPYWILGLFMIFATYNSDYRQLLRVEYKPLLKWCGFLVLITICRIIMFKIFASNEFLKSMTSGATTIPVGATLTVFWEDCAHGLPLAILSLFLGQDKLWKKLITYVAISIVMVSFGLGHLYQGYAATILLSFYIPYTYSKGQKIGFGTIMICHTLYDLVTILTLQAFLR